MRFTSLVVALAVGMSTAVSGQEITQHTSPDGHAFSFHHMPDSDRVAISIAWLGGPANIAPGKENAVSLAIDLMLNGGADGRSPDDIRAEFESMDAGSHLYSDADAIRGFLVTPAKDIEKAASIANSVLVKPDLDARWFKRFLGKTKQNAAKGELTNNGQAWNAIRHLTMGGHPLEQSWSRQPASNLDTLSVDDVRTWYQDSFSANDIAISVAGNANVEQIATGLDLTLKGLPKVHKREDYPPLQMSYSGKTILIHRPDEEKSYMAITGALPPDAHPDKLAFMLGAGVLGQSGQSRLFKAVRGELRAAYGFGARIYAFTRAQDMLAMSGEVETSKLSKTLAAVEQTYSAFKSDGIGIVEFPFAKRIMLKRIREDFAKPESIAFVMTEAHLEGQDMQKALQLEDQAVALGRGAVNAAIAKHFPNFDDMLIVVVSPDADAIEADCVISHFNEADKCL